MSRQTTRRKSWGSLSSTERDTLLERYTDGEHSADLASELGIENYQGLGRSLRKWRDKKGLPERVPEPIVMDLGEFEQYMELYNTLIGRDPSRPSIKEKHAKKTDRRKVVVVCDIHGRPDERVLVEVAKERPNTIIYDGDVFDCFAFSRHPKDHNVPIADEIASVRAMLESMHLHCDEQLLTTGNHDERAKKYFSTRVDPQFLPLINYSLLDLASAGIPNVTVVRNVYDYSRPSGIVMSRVFHNVFVAHIGDALIGHAEGARKHDTRSVAALADWANTWHQQLGFILPKLIIQAHVHGAGISYGHGGQQILVEGGFAGDIKSLQYAHDYGQIGFRPPVFGYTVFEQTRAGELWKTDLLSVRFVQV